MSIIGSIPLSENGSLYFTINNSLLSSQRPWQRIEKNKNNINKIFSNFDKDFILKNDPEYFIKEIKNIKCGSRSTKKQMNSLHYNIRMFERIENDYGSLDKFITSKAPCVIATTLAKGEYKLKQVGLALRVSKKCRY